METENKMLELLFNRPMLKFHVRQFSRDTGLDTKTIMVYLKKFMKEDIVIRKKERNHFAFYEAKRLSKLYRYKKSNFIIERIIKSQLIDYLEEETTADFIVLFGSMQKGTYYKDSDIDIFIKADAKRIDISKFEKRLGYKINLLFEDNLKKLTKGLLRNIYNGRVLSGRLEI